MGLIAEECFCRIFNVLGIAGFLKENTTLKSNAFETKDLNKTNILMQIFFKVAKI